MKQPRFTSGWLFQIRHYITYVLTIHRELVGYRIHCGIFSSWQVKTILIIVTTNFPGISDQHNVQQEDAQTLKRSIARKQGDPKVSRRHLDACVTCYRLARSPEEKEILGDWFRLSVIRNLCRKFRGE